MIDNMDKIFFAPGDVVTIKHDLPFKPVMLVKGKETKTIRTSEGTHFLGIRCVWFTTELEYQEQIFSTKDLVHVSKTKTQDKSTEPKTGSTQERSK